MRLFLICAVLCLGALEGVAQDAPASAEELARVSHELQETRSELADSRRQIEELRKGLEELRSQMQGAQSSANVTFPSADPTTAAADEDVNFLAAKVNEIHQDKVESGSKYPVKLSGLILFNSYLNNGNLDLQDLPNLAFPKTPGVANGSLGATLTQTLLGLNVTGPTLFGAKSSADISIDFAGGSPTTSYGVTNGLLRLRTATARLDWGKTSLSVGQDALFFSPLSPTSYATVKEPALAWAGNLWVWTPQIEIERRFTLDSSTALVLQGGLLDPLTEEPATFQGRVATAGEASRVPAIAGRVALDRLSAAHHPFSIGFGGYRARDRVETFREIDSWTLNTDIKIPLGSHFELSGEGYEGQAAGGLGGGIWTSWIFADATAPHSAIHPLRSAGGWAQLKIIPASRFEINGAFGQDGNYGRDLRFFPVAFTNYGFPALQKNQAGFLNVIYRPKSIFLFALEYRRLFTAPSIGESASGDQVNAAMGVHF
ncbi:MAG TPA: hypothetical protein VH079_18960 [Terriglobales bacterium]|jgi:hypothetical protein|nr:hypothetical protein [Terriglobales bacterium]